MQCKNRTTEKNCFPFHCRRFVCGHVSGHSQFTIWYDHKETLRIAFCWRLLGLIPGGAPFSQLNKGVQDAMVQSTGSVIVPILSNDPRIPRPSESLLAVGVETTHERCGPFSLVVLSQRRGRVTTSSGPTLSETLSSKTLQVS